MVVRVLIVDDNYDDVHAIRKILEHEGFLVFQATHKEDCMRIISEHNIDLVLIDVLVCGGKGCDIVKLLRKKRDYNLKIGYITIIPEREIDTRDVEGVIQKPFEPHELIRHVNRVLKGG